MAIDLSSCTVLENGNIRTCKGRSSFAFITKKNKQGKYQLTLLFPPDSDLKAMKTAMYKVALDKLGDEDAAKNAVKRRFIDPMNPPGGGKPMPKEFKGWSMIRPASNDKPDIILPNGKRCDEEDYAKEVYSGRWMRATVQAYWYKNEGSSGVTLGLQNVQLLDHDEAFGARKADGADEFDSVGDVAGSAPEDTGSDSDLDDMFD